MTLWIGNGAILIKFQCMAIKRILKINNSWTQLLNFQNSFEWGLLVFSKQTPFQLAAFWTLKQYGKRDNAGYLFSCSIPLQTSIFDSQCFEFGV